VRRYRSCAKLNLHLEVVRRRDDGFHDLRTIFQTIDLADELRVEPLARDGAVELVVRGADLPADGRNLAVRAARFWLEAWGRPGEGVRIELDKRIPVGGGLGGGSSNAATVLLALSELFGRAADRGWLAQAAARLGADVPFFLTGGTALGSGRGDEIVALPDPPDAGREVWLACPPWPSETAGVYGALAAPSEPAPPRPPIAGLLAGESAPASLLDLVGENDLEGPAFRLRPELGALYTAIDSSHALRCRLSGSGSTIFAFFRDPAEAASVARELPEGVAWHGVRTLGRSAWRAASGFADPDGGS